MKLQVRLGLTLLVTLIVAFAMGQAIETAETETVIKSDDVVIKTSDVRSSFLYGFVLGHARGAYLTNVGYSVLDSDLRDSMIKEWGHDNVCELITDMLQVLRQENETLSFNSVEAREDVASLLNEVLASSRIDCASVRSSWGL